MEKQKERGRFGDLRRRIEQVLKKYFRLYFRNLTGSLLFNGLNHIKEGATYCVEEDVLSRGDVPRIRSRG